MTAVVPMPLSWQALTVKTGSAVVLAATSDAIVGATATITVGGMASLTAIVVALLQNRKNRARDDAIEETIELRKQLAQMERDRALHLENEIAELRREKGDGEWPNG